MSLDIAFASIFILIGMAIAVPLTIVLDRRAARARKKADEYWQKVVRLEAEQEAQAQKEMAHVDELSKMQATLENKFSDLSKSALDANSDIFLKLARENFQKFKTEAGADLDRRKDSIKNIVDPLNETLVKYDKSLRQLELDRQGAYSSVKEQLKSIKESNETLRTETGNLVKALRRPEVRGQWGELQLRNVLEHVGMTEHIDFVTQETINTEGGRKRPDAIVNLPGGNCIVIDAKTPLDAYLSALESDSESEQTELYKSHAKQLRSQVKNLAASDYQSVVSNAPDFVVMFIPVESFYSVAMQHDPDLFDFALKRQVMIATPLSLVVLLKVIALGWQQEKLAENSKEIAKIGRELYERLSKFSEHIGQHGSSLAKAIESYNKAIGSMERRLLPSARKLESLEVVSSRNRFESPRTIEHQPRIVESPQSNETEK